MENINNKVVDAYNVLNAWISGEGGTVMQLLDMVYPNHDGKRYAEAEGELLYLQQQIASLSRVCEVAIDHINKALD